jgi:hypothetical protein
LANADRLRPLRDKNVFKPLPYWVVEEVSQFSDSRIVELGEPANFLHGISLLQFKEEYLKAGGNTYTLAGLKVRGGQDLLTIRQEGLETVKSQVPLTDALSDHPLEIHAAFWTRTESERFHPSDLHLYAIYLGCSPTPDILKNWLRGKQANQRLERVFGEN